MSWSIHKPLRRCFWRSTISCPCRRKIRITTRIMHVPLPEYITECMAVGTKDFGRDEGVYGIYLKKEKKGSLWRLFYKRNYKSVLITAILKLNIAYMCFDLSKYFFANDIRHNCLRFSMKDESGRIWLNSNFLHSKQRILSLFLLRTTCSRDTNVRASDGIGKCENNMHFWRL